jgi:hypothetical protein
MSDFLTLLSNDNQLIKHTATVHISNTLTLTARKTSNVLLKNAFPLLNKQERFRIKLSDLMEAIGLGKSENYRVIRDALDLLENTGIKWNVFDKDRQVDWTKKAYTSSRLIASVIYDENGGYCEYSYSYHLRELFKSPNIYAKIDLLVQRQFKSKHALALWEFLVEAMCSSTHTNKEIMSTAWIELEGYRKFLGLGDGEYQDFKDLNKFIIKKSLAEINQVSDIEAKVFYKKEARKVIALRFEIKRKAGFQTSLALENKNIDSEEYEKIQELMMSEYCLSFSKTSKLLEKYPLSQIVKNLGYVAQEKKQGGIKKIASFTVSAIENDYQIKKSKSDILAQEKGKITQKIHILKEKTKEFNKEFENYLFAVMREKYNQMNEGEKNDIIVKTKDTKPFITKMIEKDGAKSYGVEIMILSTLKDMFFNTEEKKKEAFIGYEKQADFSVENTQKEIQILEKELNNIQAK